MTPAEQTALTAAHDAYNAVAALVGTPSLEDQVTVASTAAVAPLNARIVLLTEDIAALKRDADKAATDAAA